MGYLILIAMIFTSDLFIKKYIDDNKDFKKEEEILNGNIIITKYHNSGGMLNLLEKRKNLVTILSAFMLSILFIFFGTLLQKKGNHILKLGLSMIIGGAASNVFDRIHKGFVVDYFSFKWLKKVIFNISDIFILLGSFIIIVLTIFKRD